MANASTKKGLKAAKSAHQKYILAIAVLNVFYFLLRVFWRYSSYGFWNLCGLMVLWICYGVSYFGLVYSAQNNAPSESYFDLFVVTGMVQFFVSLSDWGWILFLVVPGYIAYLGILFAIKMRSVKPSESTAVPDSEEEKKPVRKGFRATKAIKK